MSTLCHYIIVPETIQFVMTLLVPVTQEYEYVMCDFCEIKYNRFRVLHTYMYFNILNVKEIP